MLENNLVKFLENRLQKKVEAQKQSQRYQIQLGKRTHFGNKFFSKK